MNQVHPQDVIIQYLATALWSSTDDNGDALDDTGYCILNFTAEAMERASQDVSDFYNKVYDRLPPDYDLTQLGHDLWLTRNGHGAGFWDRGLGEAGDYLTDVAKKMGELYVIVNDDGTLDFY